MKNKISLLFALLCASMMSWAEPYCERVVTTTIDYTSLDVKVTVKKQDATTVRVVLDNEHITGIRAGGTFQQWGNGVWANQDDAVANFAQGWTQDGNAWHKDFVFSTYPTTGNFQIYILMDHNAGNPPVAGFTLTNIDIDNDCSGGGGDPTPNPDPEPTKASECFGAKGHFGNPTAKHVYYQIDYEANKAIISLLSLTGYPLDFAEVQIAGVGNYAMNPNGTGGYTYTINNPTVDAEWYIRFLYSDTNMPGNEMTAETQSSSDENIIFYQVGACTATVTENVNIALASEGSSATASTGNGSLAIDGTIGGASRWESASEDPQWICVNFGERKKFNMVQLVHEGAYIKTYDIQISDDGTNFTTIKHVSETLAEFPYEQTIELGFDYAAQYMRIYGTERGTGYGYSLWELRAMYSGASVLTSITLTAASNKALVGGAGVVLTATPKDQKGQAMEAEISYEIVPATAGHMSGSTYIPDQIGMATIRAYSASIYSPAVQVLGVTSANLALSTNISTDNKIIAQSAVDPNGSQYDAFHAVDGSIGSVWQGRPDGISGDDDAARTFDAWFVVDLGAFYNIDLVALHFEGACSELYHIDFSENNSDWNLGYNLVGAEGINARNDYWTDLNNNTKVRYVRFWSTKAATGWGMKLFEFEVYGTEWTSGDEEKPVMVSASLVSSTINSAVIAVSATDNDEVARYHVVDNVNGIDANFTPSAGQITIAGLTHNTTYNFTITAKDASNNESENSIVVPVTTPFDGSINLALNKSCEGGYYDNNPAESADKANDGNNGTSWVTYGAHAAALDWWVVDLGNVYNLTNITTLWANDAYATQYILQARIDAPTTEEKADDAAWVTLATVSGVTAGEERSTDVSGVGRYIRFRATAFAGGFFRLREFRVYASGIADVDTEAPVMTSASLVSNTDSHATIAVAATDNVGVAKYHVVDAINSFDAEFAAEAGNITVTGLSGGTTYNFVITAIDFFGNESANSKSVEVTTTAHYTEPQAACAAPTWDASWVKAIYSPTYTADCGLGEWGSGTTATDDTYGKKYTVGPNGAEGGYFGMVDFSLNCLMMEKLHFDIWVADDMTIRFVPIWGGAEQGITKNLSGQSWNSIDIDLTAYTGIDDWSNIYQMKLDQMPHSFNLWIANAYFYRTSAIVDSEAPTNVSASLAATGFYSVKITASAEDNSGAVNFSIKNGDTEVANGAAATGVETTITVNDLTPGTAYNFNVIALDEAGNAAAPVAVAATTKSVPAPAPAPVFSGKNVIPVFTDAMSGAPAEIHSGGWGESTQVEWVDIASSDKVFYAHNFNYAGWHSWGADIDATNMMFLHVDVYSTGMTQFSVTPISHDPTREGSATINLTPNAWTSYDVPLSAYAANNIEWNKIFQFKFMNPVGGNEFMIDNVYFWQPVANTTPDNGGETGGWATFSCAEKVAVPAGVTAYKAVYEKTATEEVMNLTDIGDVIPAGEGVILKGDAGTAYAFSVTDATPTEDMSDNMLVGCPVRTDITSVLVDNDVFCLRYSELYSLTGFFLYTGQYVPAGKAYLALPKATPGAGSTTDRGLRFVINDTEQTTAITGVETENTKITKFVENGQLFIRRGDTVYTIQGTRVK